MPRTKAAAPQIKVVAPKKVYQYPDKYKKKEPITISRSAMDKQALRDLVLKHGFSISDAAAKFDMDEGRVERLLFSKVPTAQQYDYALEIYNKGFSMTVACVGAGVSFAHFKKARKEAMRHEYRPLRW
jgi:hypothetical protein